MDSPLEYIMRNLAYIESIKLDAEMLGVDLSGYTGAELLRINHDDILKMSQMDIPLND